MGKPQLRIVRADEAQRPLERAPLIAPRLIVVTPRPRARWWDSVAFGVAVCVSLFVGAVLIALAMGWVRP